MLKGIASFLIKSLSKRAITDLIKAQIPKLSDEQKQEILVILTQLTEAAAKGAVSGATSRR